jgi:hypothetical protein
VKDARFVRVDSRFRAEGDFDGPLRMVIAAADGDIEVPIDEAGHADFPLSPALYDEDPPVRVNVGQNRLTMSFTIAVEAPPARTFRYALVTEMEDEYREAVARQGVLARMFTPRPKGIRIEFAPGDDGIVEVRAPRPTTHAANGDGTVVIPFSRQWRRADVEFGLSHLPVRIGLSFQ